MPPSIEISVEPLSIWRCSKAGMAANPRDITRRRERGERKLSRKKERSRSLRRKTEDGRRKTVAHDVFLSCDQVVSVQTVERRGKMSVG